jgi:hypothetical protein
VDEKEEEFTATDRTKELWRLSDASGKMNFKKEKTDHINRSDFDSSVSCPEFFYFYLFLFLHYSF